MFFFSVLSMIIISVQQAPLPRGISLTNPSLSSTLKIDQKMTNSMPPNTNSCQPLSVGTRLRGKLGWARSSCTHYPAKLPPYPSETPSHLSGEPLPGIMRSSVAVVHVRKCSNLYPNSFETGHCAQRRSHPSSVSIRLNRYTKLSLSPACYKSIRPSEGNIKTHTTDVCICATQVLEHTRQLSPTKC
ncbi:hypothetical protein BJ878DRAFT_237499 [Calycina marina]|uniref:Secreted protein n=1 Tax=Calycina marina TaxID=1763456 RepID=A0A9P7ZBB1_9HELO|nr:hypothetical protein BJ878DRAFT_237499 [Calycina marina]